MKGFITLLILCFLPLCADPWGKDADLVRKTPSALPPSNAIGCDTPVLGPFAEIMIGFHQNVVSPVQGPRSHFNPSSSHYTLNAMRKYGFVRGFVMGCDRLMRENNDNWVYRTSLVDGELMKYDPVP